MLVVSNLSMTLAPERGSVTRSAWRGDPGDDQQDGVATRTGCGSSSRGPDAGGSWTRGSSGRNGWLPKWHRHDSRPLNGVLPPLSLRRSTADLGCLVIVLATLLLSSPAHACRYNVRDVGFVDLGADPYRLLVYFRGDTAPDLETDLESVALPILRDTNVRLERVKVDAQPPPPGLEHLSAAATNAWPCAVLVSPDRHTLPWTLTLPGQPFRQALPGLLEALVTSPTRSEILRLTGRTFGVVLLIEGPDAAQNQAARAAIANALDQVRAQMKTLPKAIAEPPALLVLEHAALAREKVLLWSLGLEPGGIAETRAAVIYGRARWMGPLMRAAEITDRNVAGLLSIIGADCECGLDLTWTLGTRLPVRWDEQHHAEVSRSLGFDPENPLVKIEVSRIVGRGGTTPAAPSALGYQEIPLAPAASPPPSAARPETAGALLEEATTPGPPPATAAGPQTRFVLLISLLFFGGLAVLVGGSAVAILWYVARKRKQR